MFRNATKGTVGNGFFLVESLKTFRLPSFETRRMFVFRLLIHG